MKKTHHFTVTINFTINTVPGVLVGLIFGLRYKKDTTSEGSWGWTMLTWFLIENTAPCL